MSPVVKPAIAHAFDYDALVQIHNALYAKLRVLEGRAKTPTLSIVDSQTVKSAEKGGRRVIRPDMTQARKLKEKNVTRPSIRSAF